MYLSIVQNSPFLYTKNANKSIIKPMDTLIQSQVFFFISSVGFIMLWILLAIFLVYVIRFMHSFSKIMYKLEENLDNISDTTKDMLLDMKDSAIFKFLFGHKKKHHTSKKS